MSVPPLTQMLRAWRQGDDTARDAVVTLVYDQLRGMARRHLEGEGSGHTLQPTALVHEAYLRLADADVEWQDRVHFYAIAARVMRRILVDHAKARSRIKRGAGAERISLSKVELIAPIEPDVLELDQALDRLAAFDDRKSRVVELLYFGGLTCEEAATAVDVSVATLQRELKMAKAWLVHELRQPPGALSQ